MNKIKLLSLVILGLSVSNITHAEYSIQYKLDKNIVF